MIHAKTSYFPAWNKRFYFLYFIDSSDSFHPFRRNFDRSFIFTTDNIPLLFQVQLGSRCHQAESAYPTIKVTQVFPSSPCLGILFSPQGHYHIQLFFELFSSPCLGILFSRQAWGAPRGGLSIALLRRGFPIDWNSHYFHPLTYCFLRFHAHRRGFSK